MPSCKQETKKLAKRLDVQREQPVKKVVKEDKPVCPGLSRREPTGGASVKFAINTFLSSRGI